jgi:hypothetical protein
MRHPSPPAILLRESCCESGRIKKRTLLNLSDWPHERIAGLKALLKGGTVRTPSPSSAPCRAVEAALGTARRIGLDRLIGPAGNRCRDLVLPLVISRLIEPGSKLAAAHVGCRRASGGTASPISPTTAVRQAEVTAQQRMIDRTQERFGLWPRAAGRRRRLRFGQEPRLGWCISAVSSRIFRCSANPSAATAPTRADFAYDHKRDCYLCPAGKGLRQRQKIYRMPRPSVDQNGMMRYSASKLDRRRPLKRRCCPNAPARKILRSIHEGARDMARDIARTEAYATSRRQRKKIEMLFAHLKRILKLDRLRLRGPNGARDEFHLAATAQNLRKLAMLIPVPAPISVT